MILNHAIIEVNSNRKKNIMTKQLSNALNINSYAILTFDVAGRLVDQQENLAKLLNNQLTASGEQKTIKWIASLFPKSGNKDLIILSFETAWLIFLNSSLDNRFNKKNSDKYRNMVLMQLI